MVDKTKIMDDAVTAIRVPIKEEASFDWKALFSWFFALILSLIPIAVVAIEKYLNKEPLGNSFLIELFTEQDTLWAFATLLAVSLANIMAIGIKGKASSFQVALLLASFLIVLLIEIYWLICRYLVTDPGPPVYWIGFVLCGFSLFLSLPIQITYIKTKGR